METKKIFKLFYVFDYDRLEQWLRKMANDGWIFERVNCFGVYTFIKGTSSDIIYKVDYNKHIKDLDEYYTVFKESGWQIVYENNNYRIFRSTASNTGEEIGIYNDPREQISWLRKRLIIFLSGYGVEFVSLYYLFILQNDIARSNKWNLCVVLITTFLTVPFIRFLSFYIPLERKLKQSEYKDYYGNSFLKRVYKIASIVLIPLIISLTLAVTITYMATVGDNENSIKREILSKDSDSKYDMRSIDFTASEDIGHSKVCLYGNDNRIGVVTVEEIFLNRYKVKMKFSSQAPEGQFISMENIDLNNSKYFIFYGKDNKKIIDKLLLIYADGSNEELSKDNFKLKNDYFIMSQKNNKDLKEVKVIDNTGNDITNEFKQYVSKHM
ncbi:DUF2812 domain-containing protein [Clostridium manihotivorum]|uniref:DUF2812 domain-containing protein n=1 Tax=Clostridium manihotivorum TaxID=2320868 RepID=UPI001EE5A7C1|nr:DUF2812 domain-containing protein [Clostridium manihotivorum]